MKRPHAATTAGNLTVVIPVLNEAANLATLLPTLAGGGSLVAGVICSDGGSTDSSPAVARRHGADVIAGPPGRGGQLRRGAARAAAGWLWLLHADTGLPAGWPASMIAALAAADPSIAYYGRLRFASADPRARLIETCASLRCRLFRLPYGDQSLLIHSALLDHVGGVPDLALMEDVALARRLGRRRLAPLDLTVETDADAYRRDGWFTRPAANLLRLASFLAGRDAAALAESYRR